MAEKIDTPIHTSSDAGTISTAPILKKEFDRSGIEVLDSGHQSIPKIYSCVIEPTLKDSNAYGNIYFSRYFEWQGVVREKWFTECVCSNMFALEGVLITKSASIEYIKPVYPFEKINATLSTKSIRSTSFIIEIQFLKQTELIASGVQTIVFGAKNGKIAMLPKDIKEKIMAYAIS